jgi:uncharacterized protein YkwD
MSRGVAFFFMVPARIPAVLGPLLLAAAPASLAHQVAQRAAPPRGPELRIDPSLARAAERHLTEVFADPSRATLERVQAALVAEGLADAQVLPFTTLGTDRGALEDALLAFAKDTASSRAMTHVGVASLERGGRMGLAALFSRRLVELSPLPRSPKERHAIVRGRVAIRDAHVEALLRTPCQATCTGDVVTLRATLSPRPEDPLLTIDVPFKRGDGRYALEILAEHDRGPEVAALWTFSIGSAPQKEPELPKAADDPRGLEALISAERTRRDLAPLERSPSLDRAAADHAAAVCRSMIAAHVLSPGDTPTARAKRAGHAGRVAENIAIASSIARAHENLMSSPSHRRNVLDPAAATLGLGVAEHDKSWCAVELFGFEE